MQDDLDQRISNSIETYFYARNKDLLFMRCMAPKKKVKYSPVIFKDSSTSANKPSSLKLICNVFHKKLENTEILVNIHKRANLVPFRPEKIV